MTRPHSWLRAMYSVYPTETCWSLLHQGHYGMPRNQLGFHWDYANKRKAYFFAELQITRYTWKGWKSFCFQLTKQPVYISLVVFKTFDYRPYFDVICIQCYRNHKNMWLINRTNRSDSQNRSKSKYTMSDLDLLLSARLSVNGTIWKVLSINLKFD